MKRIVTLIDGLGLRAIIERAYVSLCAAYKEGDSLFFLGFSRGAYAARALAGLVAASGIVAQPDAAEARVAWNHYRVAPAARSAPFGGSAEDQGDVVDSTIGWWFDRRWPRLRAMLSPDAFDPGFFRDDDDPRRENVNERVHWSVLEKTADRAYAPANLPANLPPARVAAMTAEEARWLGRRPVP